MLVVGAGKVALRKVQGLIEADAAVTVVSPVWHAEFENLPLRLIPRPFKPSDLAGVVLVFAATNDRHTNQRISRLARKHGIFANIADSLEECDFIVPARIARGNVQIAVSTGGRSPRLASDLRKKLEKVL